MAEGKFPAYLAASRSLPGSWYSLNGNLHNFLRDIPCGELPVSLKSKNKLAAFGLSTLGEITGLPRSALEAQFGPEGRIIHQLAAGYDPSPLVPRLPREIINARVELETAPG
jgi:nucleotidyltransferase/DNA polymerase involved in DNA repair